MNVVPQWIKGILMWGIILPLVGLTITTFRSYMPEFISMFKGTAYESMTFQEYCGPFEILMFGILFTTMQASLVIKICCHFIRTYPNLKEFDW